MTWEKLLEVQSGLIACLTDWGDSADLSRVRPSVSQHLEGIDPRVLELVAVLALGKRIDKIFKALPKTLSYFRGNVKDLARQFAARHPPLRADSYFNACQFYGFLRRQWLVKPPEPPFLPDLAYAELAVIAVDRRTVAGSVPLLASACRLEPFRIRRHPAVHMRPCEYDIHPLLGTSETGHDIHRRPVYLIISRPIDGDRPAVFQVDECLFEVLRSLGSWTVQTPERLESDPRILDFYGRMENLGFIEVRQCELD